jgi:hypothetical protein
MTTTTPAGGRARGPLLFAAFASALVAGGTYVARDLDAPPVSAAPQARPATPTSELVLAHPDHAGGASTVQQRAGGDGELPHGASPFDLDLAGIAHLDPALRAALQQASRAAAGDGVDLVVNSGWRSKAYQQRLLDDAVATYGSRAEAARWVATPQTSSHVSGKAVDIGPKEGAAWLDEHGAHYGLCRTYRNEAWHFELRPDARDDGCPAMYADPTDDPRMQR